jgi:monovalent cation:H+ antiporter-2, CPA2 family
VAAPINIDAYSDALVVLATAGIVVPLVRRWGFSSILGYLGAGAVLGPLGLGSFKDAVPLLYWFTVVDAKNVAGIAELGVVFLFFLIGLELSWDRLVTMRRLVFGLGGLQIILSTLAIGGIAAWAGATTAAALILGSCLALSSTAIVIELLSAQRRLSTRVGRTSFAVLLAQDLAVIPILLFISSVGTSTGSAVLTDALLALTKAAVAVGLIVIIGRLLLQPLFRLVASTGASELFVAATLFVIVGTGVAAGLAGISMALGAFVAGLLLAETEYVKAIQTTIEPFKGLLLGLFFFTVGMNVDLRELVREPVLLLAAVAGLIGIKSLVLVGLARQFSKSWPVALETSLLLGPGGEFAFVGIGMAATLGLTTQREASFALAVTSLSMALLPLLSVAGRRLRAKVEPSSPMDPSLLLAPTPMQDHAIVVGHGRVGRIICTMLDRHQFPYVAVDKDPAAIAEYRKAGRQVFYGEASDLAFLKSCGLAHARVVVVTIHTKSAIDDIVKLVRRVRPDIAIISRARDAEHARHLYAIDVTDAVPETVEASLQLSEATLVSIGLPAGPVIASIHQLRDEFRQELQEAAGRAGRQGIHSIRAKTLRR